ncbi:MAG: transposase, partial [Deltaproteobacteria bacterium]|nr:transposase [Deltaproteobacteria bacterium]
MAPSIKSQSTYLGRREPRPFSPTQALHVTLKSELAKGPLSMASPSHRAWVRQYIPLLARKLGIRLYHFANNGSHIHLIFYSKDKKAVSAYRRALSGVIARRIMKAEKGRAKKIRFWLSRPFSRILSWGRDFRRAMNYVERNRLEANNIIPYRKRTIDLEAKYKEQVSQSLCKTKLLREQLMTGQMILSSNL